ncbi:ABC transporter C family member 14, partial [Camellia lanceoleosa]
KPLLVTTKSYPRVTIWFNLCLVLTALLAICYTVLCILAVCQAITHVSILILIAHERKLEAVSHPMSLRVYWVANFVVLCLLTASGIARFITVGGNFDTSMKVDDIVSIFVLPISAFLLFVAVKGTSGIVVGEQDRRYKSTLKMDDVPSLSPEHRAEKNGGAFYHGSRTDCELHGCRCSATLDLMLQLHSIWLMPFQLGVALALLLLLHGYDIQFIPYSKNNIFQYMVMKSRDSRLKATNEMLNNIACDQISSIGGTFQSENSITSWIQMQLFRNILFEKDFEVMDHEDQTEIGGVGSSLSGGQKQRIQLAGAVYETVISALLDDILVLLMLILDQEIFQREGILTLIASFWGEFYPRPCTVEYSRMGRTQSAAEILPCNISRELTCFDSNYFKAPVIHHFSKTASESYDNPCFRKQERFFQEIKLTGSMQIYLWDFHTTIRQNEWFGFRLELIGAFSLHFYHDYGSCWASSKLSIQYVGLALSYGLPERYVVFTVYMSCNVENKMVSVERIKQFIRIPSEAAWRIPDCLPQIQTGRSVVRYRPNTPLVIKGITLNIHGGEKVGIVGRTGSGKSTLIQVFFRLVEPSGGKIIIDGVDICKLGLHDLRPQFGIILRPCAFQGTVRSNIDPIGLYSDTKYGSIAHRIPTVMDCDKVMDGQEYEAPSQLLERPSLFGALVQEYASRSEI